MDKHPNLKVRVVHGNTLTAAVILNEIPQDVKEVFLTGATSKLGRAIALYLCQKKVRVLVTFLPLLSSVIDFFTSFLFLDYWILVLDQSFISSQLFTFISVISSILIQLLFDFTKYYCIACTKS